MGLYFKKHIQRRFSIILLICFILFNFSELIFAQIKKSGFVIKTIDNLIVIDVGKEDNLEENVYFSVYRTHEADDILKKLYLGIIQIHQIDEKLSVGKIIYKSKKEEIALLDNVSLIHQNQINSVISLIEKGEAEKFDKSGGKWFYGRKVILGIGVITGIAVGLLLSSALD